MIIMGLRVNVQCLWWIRKMIMLIINRFNHTVRFTLITKLNELTKLSIMKNVFEIIMRLSLPGTQYVC